jgi:hypothetical protein
MTHPLITGPLGIPMTDRQAIAIDAILKALPKDETFRYRKALMAEAPTEILPGERSDVSWITTENVDRQGDVIIAKGMNESQFKLNPIVTLEHCYEIPPVGKSLWRKVVKDGVSAGVKAKTVYPARPGEWPAEKDWPADVAFSLIKAGLMQGKSIGVLPTKVHFPSAKEIDQYGKSSRLVIDEWLLIEYACTTLPVQQNALVEAVSKGAVRLPAEFIKAMRLNPGVIVPAANEAVVVSRFLTLDEVEKSICRRLAAVDIAGLAEKAAQEAIDRRRGRV